MDEERRESLRRVTRVSALLDDAVEVLTNPAESANIANARATATIREAQGVLLGDVPVSPRDN